MVFLIIGIVSLIVIIIAFLVVLSILKTGRKALPGDKTLFGYSCLVMGFFIGLFILSIVFIVVGISWINYN